ncbi:class E sortase [Streptomyces sp. NBC_01304]|nr:class E sortase [Streptomyces sp. NBC_01304]
MRPEHESDASYGSYPYEESGTFEAAGTFEEAVEQLADPLNDPLPGQHPSPWFRAAGAEQQPQQTQQPQQSYEAQQRYEAQQVQQQAQQHAQHAQQAREQAYQGYAEQALDPIAQAADHRPAMDASAYEAMYADPADTTYGTGTYAPRDDETVGLRTSDTRRIAESEEDDRDDEDGSRSEPAGEGRAARRRAAQEGARRGGTRRRGGGPASGGGSTGSAPMSRLEARRAERAKKPSPAVIASRAVGELFISIGVLMLLFVTYQLWWTNIRAGQQAGAEANKIHENWANGKGKPGAFEPGQGFAIMHIPRLDVVVPIAEGIDKQKVLDRGMVGHYAEKTLKTAMPEDKKGNFAVAGHRNTHGEPFRYINRLEPGDEIIVETQDTYFVYKVSKTLPQTSPSNTGVIAPVPPGSGFTEPGRYITLTTCTPEFTSTYRLIVWGKMAEERPRSKGKPKALVS